jgi:hypothetical protein
LRLVNVGFLQLLAVALPPYDTLEEVIGIWDQEVSQCRLTQGFRSDVPEVPVPVSQFLPSQPYSAYDISNCTVGLWPVEVLMTTDEASVIALQQMVALIGMLLLAL